MTTVAGGFGHARPVVWFVTDYGLADPFVGVCHAVIAARAPTVRVVDLAHGILPGAVRQGAVVLADALPWLTPGVILAVVDPGVGTARRPIVVTAGTPTMLLVGPDNGLLRPAVERLGGVAAAWRLHLPVRGAPAPSGTFDGRDVFAPAAALLAAGAEPASLGAPVPAADLVDLTLPGAAVASGRVTAEVLQTDRFGNLQLAATPSDLLAAGLPAGSRVQVTAGGVDVPGRVTAAFSDIPVGEVAVLGDAWGRMQVAVNRGSAAQRLGAGAGGRVTVAADGVTRR